MSLDSKGEFLEECWGWGEVRNAAVILLFIIYFLSFWLLRQYRPGGQKPQENLNVNWKSNISQLAKPTLIEIQKCYFILKYVAPVKKLFLLWFVQMTFIKLRHRATTCAILCCLMRNVLTNFDTKEKIFIRFFHKGIYNSVFTYPSADIWWNNEYLFKRDFRHSGLHFYKTKVWLTAR